MGSSSRRALGRGTSLHVHRPDGGVRDGLAVRSARSSSLHRARRRRLPEGRRPARLVACAAAVVISATCVLMGPAASASVAQGGEGNGNISVTQLPSSSFGFCAPARMALSRSVHSDDSTFRLRIDVSAPLCEPIDAVAAIYAMPGGGVAWPQQLVEREAFTIRDAGVVTVTFTKTCAPVQFDVLTGATPATIAPWAEHHGPLLFPMDVDTSYQHWGGLCEGTTTTTTTTTPSVAPTTSTPTTLPDESSTTTTTTTAAPAGGATTTTTGPQVLSASLEPPPAGDQPEVLAASTGPGGDAGPSSLALTGLGLGGALLAGSVLVLAGASVDALRRTRRRH